MRAAAELEDVDVAVVRAAFAVAETGSIFLSEAELGLNALGYLAQHLVALLDPADILGNLHHAYRHPAFCDGALCGLDVGSVRDRRHRGRADPRRARRAQPQGPADPTPGA